MSTHSPAVEILAEIEHFFSQRMECLIFGTVCGKCVSAVPIFSSASDAPIQNRTRMVLYDCSLVRLMSVLITTDYYRRSYLRKVIERLQGPKRIHKLCLARACEFRYPNLNHNRTACVHNSWLNHIAKIRRATSRAQTAGEISITLLRGSRGWLYFAANSQRPVRRLLWQIGTILKGGRCGARCFWLSL